MLRRLTAHPLVLFGVLAVLLVASWLLLQRRERESLEERLELSSVQVASRLELFLEHHFERIRLLARELSAADALSEEVFRSASAAYQARHEGLQALNWVTPDGVIRWVEPEESNRDALGFDLDDHPVAASAFAEALESGRLTATPPTELLQGGYGFAAYLRLERDGETFGLLNAVFRLPILLSGCIEAREEEEFAYLLRYGEDVLGALGPRPRELDQFPLAEAPVEVAGRRLTLTVVAPPPLLAAHATWVDEALLALGLLLAGWLARLAHVARVHRRRAEVSAERVRVLLENAPDAIVAIDAETGRFINGNARAVDVLGVPAGELEGLHPADLAPPEQPDGRPSREVFEARMADARRGEGRWFPWTVRGPDGDERPTEVHLVGLPNAGRSILRASILDVTERSDLEAQLRRTQAHEAMGRLAGGVAHDFNNLLTVVLGAAELLSGRTRGDPESGELVEGIVETCERAAKLTRQLLAFSRHSALNPRPLDPNEVVRGIVPMLERVMSERVRIELDLRARSPILADPAQIELAILNLAINGRDAMPDGGTITIATEEERPRHVALIVRDDGEGIPTEIIDRVFEPYFTTKHPDVGTGIGLATVRQIVTRAGGRITVESRPGEGSTFRAVFPVHEGAAEHSPAASSAPRALSRDGGGAAVLVVEDNPGVLSVIRRVLAGGGYRVLAADSAEQALRVEREHDGPIDLLVTDVVLPNRNGVELMEQIRGRRPETPAILISGYSATELQLDALRSNGRVELLAKPFLPSELLEQVREILAVDAAL